MEGSTYPFDRSDPYGLLDTTSHVSHEGDMSWYDGSAFLAGFTDLNESANTDGDDDVTKDSTNESIKWIFGMANVNPKYRMFDANYYTI